LHIGLIGGVERTEGSYHAVAQAAGHTLDFHSGHVQGRGTSALERLVRTADLLVIATDVNSHTAVQLARRLARREGTPVLLLRRCSPNKLGEIIAEQERTNRAAV